MKRSAPIRKTPMPPRRKPLASRTPLKRSPIARVLAAAGRAGLQLMRGSALRPVSAKRMKLAKARSVCRAVVMERSAGRCEIGIGGICTKAAEHVHEVLTRGRGGSITDPANCLAACPVCHEFIHGNSTAATVLGLLVSGHRPVEPIAETAPSQRRTA